MEPCGGRACFGQSNLLLAELKSGIEISSDLDYCFIFCCWGLGIVAVFLSVLRLQVAGLPSGLGLGVQHNSVLKIQS